MIKVMYQIVRRRKRNSSSEIIIPNSVIHHLDIDMTRAEILILIFHATGKLIKIEKKILCSLLLEFFKWWLKNKLVSRQDKTIMLSENILHTLPYLNWVACKIIHYIYALNIFPPIKGKLCVSYLGVFS